MTDVGVTAEYHHGHQWSTPLGSGPLRCNATAYRGNTHFVYRKRDSRGLGLATFTRVPQRHGDPDQPHIDLDQLTEFLAQVPTLDVPVREVAGIEVIDASSGLVELTLRPDLANPSGASQGAMVAFGRRGGSRRTVVDDTWIAAGRNGPRHLVPHPSAQRASPVTHPFRGESHSGYGGGRMAR